MSDVAEKTPAEPLNIDINLAKTARPETEPRDFYWDGDKLVHVGRRTCNCSSFNVLEPAIARSLRNHVIEFAEEGKYSPVSTRLGADAIALCLKRYPTRTFDKK